MGRSFLVSLLLFGACNGACTGDAKAPSAESPAGDAGAAAPDSASATAGVELLAWSDLPRTLATQALSGTFYDAATRTLWAIQDNRPRLVPIEVSEDMTAFTPGPPLALTGRPGSAWDGEGLVRIGDAFVAVTEETAPIVERFDSTGAFVDAVAMPTHFGSASQATGNKGLESLSTSPDGRFLFTANESALTTDGARATSTRGTTVRILRRELATSRDEERAYRTEPLGEGGSVGDMGVSEIAALSEDSLLVLERGFQPDFGNTVRLYRVSFASAPDVIAEPSLDASTAVLDKTLVVDFAELPSEGVTHPSTQPNPLLDNYEALAIGPTLPDGRIVVFVTSDDNASAEQVARVLVLAVPPR